MGEIITFPADNYRELRQAVSRYQAGDINEAVALFEVARHHIQPLVEFQDAVIEEFLERKLHSEARHLVDEILYTTEDVERVLTLIERFDETLPIDMEVNRPVKPILPEEIMKVLMNQDLKLTEQLEALVERLHHLAPRIDRATPKEQLSFIQALHELPRMEQAPLLKQVLGNERIGRIMRCDLLHLFMGVGADDEAVTLSDYRGNRQVFHLRDLVSLDDTPYFQAGRDYIEELANSDPFTEQALVSEWVLFCSFMFPFLDADDFAPEEVVVFLNRLIAVGEDGAWTLLNDQNPKTRELLTIERQINQELPPLDDQQPDFLDW